MICGCADTRSGMRSKNLFTYGCLTWVAPASPSLKPSMQMNSSSSVRLRANWKNRQPSSELTSLAYESASTSQSSILSGRIGILMLIRIMRSLLRGDCRHNRGAAIGGPSTAPPPCPGGHRSLLRPASRAEEGGDEGFLLARLDRFAAVAGPCPGHGVEGWAAGQDGQAGHRRPGSAMTTQA